MADKKNKNAKNPFQDTLNLPHTDFPIRAYAATKEPEILARWAEEELSAKAQGINKDAEPFVMHDGPPYTNGHIHLGHAFNKILKDIVCKSRRMEGKHVPFTPGWDCHGLPIELKVTTELGIEESKIENKGITEEERAARVAFKKQCRAYAQKWIDIQREEFKELGVLADWNNIYYTMEPAYEASIIEAFADFVEKGYIERKGKTVSWCASCQTVLASAEIEHKERKDPSTYILFPMSNEVSHKIFPFAVETRPELVVNMLIWTTTPWTIPLNRAIALHPTAPYVLLQGRSENEAFIVAKALADKVCEVAGIEKVELAECDATVFKGKHALHPYIEDQKTPIIFDDSVLLTDGTACVHSAPGCGPEDYLLGIKNNLEIFSPLSPDGKYQKGIKPAELEGMSITDGQIWSLRKLKETNTLFHKSSIRHAYPHCWRCRNGLMFRATDQWFCDLQKNSLTDSTLAEIEKMQFIPEWGKARLEAFVSGRSEWCISRQREWGVPIVSLLCKVKDCGWAYLDAGFIRAVAKKVSTEGVEYWDRVTLPELVEDGLLPKDFSCGSCGNSDLSLFGQERDILDVWFDSGVSHHAVLKRYPELTFPADLYLEGSDQHRGWFQSSLLSSMVVNGKAQAKAVMTHGFLVDEKKHKMSKSLGNVVAPQDVIKNFSRDVLRLWVASTDFSGDVVISDKLLKNVAEVYRKIRNTCRFMLSNLYDFDAKKDSVEFGDLLKIDQYILMQLQDLHKGVLEHYQNYHFAGVVQLLNNFCVNNLSSMYLDIAKDRLYVEKADGKLRRSCQTALYHILDSLSRLMAPVLSFLAEEVTDAFDGGKQKSIHLALFSSSTVESTQDNAWSFLEQLRSVVLKAIEGQRQAGMVKHSLEAQLTLYVDFEADGIAPLKAFVDELSACEDKQRFFKDWFIVSQVEFTQAADSLPPTDLPWARVAVAHADGNKCPRCWQWSPAQEGQLCKRCENSIN